MSNQTFDIFGQPEPVNKLAGIRICFTGNFSVEPRIMNKKLKALGVDKIDRVSVTREFKEKETIPPQKKDTCLFIVGSEPNEESIKRYYLNKHDGFNAVMVNEQELEELMAGTSDIDVPQTMVKKLDLTYDYYKWEAPVINGNDFVSRVSSPYVYDYEKFYNRLAQKEIYVPDMPGVDMVAFRQLIGNLGGYANLEYYANTNVIMLSDNTLTKWKQGIKDEFIIDIESKYNNSSSEIFNVQFTSESEFISWAKARLEKFPDESSILLLNRYLESKK